MSSHSHSHSSALRVTRTGGLTKTASQCLNETDDSFLNDLESTSGDIDEISLPFSDIILENIDKNTISSAIPSSTTIAGIVSYSDSGIIEGKLLQREELAPFGIAKLLPSLLKPWRERFAVLNTQRLRMRVWHNSDDFHNGDDPLEDITFTPHMSLSTVKANNYDGRRILYRFVAIVPVSLRSSPRSGGAGGRSTSTEAADTVHESAKVFRFGADSQAAFEIWSVGIRKAVEEAEKQQLQIDDERGAFELGSRLNTSSLLQRALSSPPRSLSSQERSSGFRNTTTSETRRPTPSSTSLLSNTQSRDSLGGSENSSLSIATTLTSTASHIVSAFGAIYNQSASPSCISLRIHFLDNSCLSLPPLSSTLIARDVCVMVSRLISLKADADFSLFLRQIGDESSFGIPVFTCVPDLLSLHSLDSEMEKCRGILVYKRRIYIPHIPMPIPGFDSRIRSSAGGSDSGETSRFRSCGDGEPEPLARDSRELQSRNHVSSHTPVTSVPLSINVSNYASRNSECNESPLLTEITSPQPNDAVDTEANNATSPLEGALRLAYAEANFNVREGLYLLPFKDCLTLAGLQLVCEKTLLGRYIKNDSASAGKSGSHPGTSIRNEETVDESLQDNDFDLLPPPPLEWYKDRIADLLPAYALIEHKSITRERQRDDAEASAREASRISNFQTLHSGLSSTSDGTLDETSLARELRRVHVLVVKRVTYAAMVMQRKERQARTVESEPCESQQSHLDNLNVQQRHSRVTDLIHLLAQKSYTQRVRKLSEYGACSFFVGELSRDVASASVGTGSRGATPTPAWAASLNQATTLSTSSPKRIKVLVTISHLGIFLRPLPPRHGHAPSASLAVSETSTRCVQDKEDHFIIPGDPSCFDSNGTPWSWQIHSVQLIEVWGVKKTRPGFVYRVRERKLINVEISTAAFKEIAGTLHSVVFALMNQREGRPRLVVRDIDEGSGGLLTRSTTTSSSRGRQLAQAAIAAARDARDTAQASLPSGWSEIIDPSTGQTAWWNVESRVTVFSRPIH